MSDWPRFTVGEVYRFEQIQRYTWCPTGTQHLSPNALLRYVEDESGERYFVELEERRPYSLVPAAEVADAVRELRQRGLSARDIGRLAGVSAETAERALAGTGVIRVSTRDAIIQAVNANGR